MNLKIFILKKIVYSKETLIYILRCGTVLSVVWNQERKAAGYFEPDDMDTERAIVTAIEALRILISEDKE